MDWLCSSQRITLEEAFWTFPLRLAFALVPEAQKRCGFEVKAPDSAMQASYAARARMKAVLEKHYRILPPAERTQRTQGPKRPAR